MALRSIPPNLGFFYESLDPSSTPPSSFLPSIWEACTPPPHGIRRFDRLWKSDHSLRWNLNCLMDVVACLLPNHDRAYHSMLSGQLELLTPPRLAFLPPYPVDHCMQLNRKKASSMKYVYTDKSKRRGYVQLTLFYQEGKDVRIWAHRFLLWAMKGVSPHVRRNQAMHTCPEKEDSACATPDHLKWATPKENARDFQIRLLEGRTGRFIRR